MFKARGGILNDRIVQNIGGQYQRELKWQCILGMCRRGDIRPPCQFLNANIVRVCILGVNILRSDRCSTEHVVFDQKDDAHKRRNADKLKGSQGENIGRLTVVKQGLIS